MPPPRNQKVQCLRTNFTGKSICHGKIDKHSGYMSLINVTQLRNLEKFELNALGICKDEEFKEKLKVWVQKKKEPLDNYGLKKLKDKIEKHQRKMAKAQKKEGNA